MKSFSEYFRLREDGDFPDPTRLGSTSDNTEVLSRMTKLAWDRYEPETKNFFQQLADKDPDIKDEFNKIDDGRSKDINHNRDQNSEKDVIAPPEADTSPGLDGDG